MVDKDIFNADIRYLGDMSKISLNPGDVLILQCEENPTMDDIKTLSAHMKEVFPNNRTAVFGKGMRLGVLDAGGVDRFCRILKESE